MDATLDLTDTPEEIQRELLRPGIYPAVVNEVTYGKSRKGNPMLTWIFGVQAEDDREVPIWYHTTLNTEQGLTRTKRAIIRLLNDDEEMDWSQFKPGDLGWLEGRGCRLRIGVSSSDEYGKSNSVRDVLKAQEGFLQ